jgi:carbon-monoxide dehydrogenase medium subunit
MRIPAYHRPTTLDEAWRLKAQGPQTAFVAGGTDVLVRIREGSQRPSALVSLRNIPELCGIQFDGGLRIGALTPIADVFDHPSVGENYPVLVQAARTLGSVQIRNLATIGGNLCNASPCADMAPPLLVLGARMRIGSPNGERELPLEDFFVAPGETRLAANEIVTSIVVDAPAEHSGAHFLKMTRVAMDIALVNAAVMLRLDGEHCAQARVAVGSAAPTPIRMPETEKVLVGSVIDDAVLAQAARTASQEVTPITDKRTTEAYRRKVAGVLVKRAAAAVLEGVLR